MNRMANCRNPYQGEHKKVLCVCSAGLLRSPTTAMVLSKEPFNFNTRAVGLNEDYALIPIDDVLVRWADVIVCMEEKQAEAIKEMYPETDTFPPSPSVICLDIPDNFPYRDPKLVELITERCQQMVNAAIL